jgi:hypothetical protein
MPQTCNRCRRANPRDATYCYHDGGLLAGHFGGDIPADGSAMNLGTRPFPRPFVSPSGLACHNFLQLTLALHADQAGALKHLQQGHLEKFFAALGRADLAEATAAAARASDRTRGLDDLLGRLPASALTPARLQVEPLQLDLGVLRPGEDRQVKVKLRNQGMRLLYGSANCASTLWLALSERSERRQRLFQLSSEGELTIRVVGRRLRAYRKPQEGEVLLESNGGTAAIVVRVQVPAQPFPDGVLAGVVSPRELAEKARQAPKEAASLIESGAVARWYEANGWTYPVAGPTAAGAAAVQQLFEALGLVKPPRVQPNANSLDLRGPAGAKLETTLTLTTEENRAAWAFGSSDQPWLRIGAPEYRGRAVALPLSIAPVPDKPGATLQAVVSITANGGQKFAVPVALAVEGTTPPASPPRPAPPAAEQTRGSLWNTVFPAVLLLVLVAAAALRDYLAPAHVAAIAEEEVVDSDPRIAILFHNAMKNDELEKLWLTDPHPSMRFGVVMVRKGQETEPLLSRPRLTFDPWGRTNNACVRFDGFNDERLFGGPGGTWEEREAKTWKDERSQDHEGVRSVWSCDDKGIKVTQFVELVRGEQSRLLDTCRVRYRLENAATGKEHRVGIRFLLDTYIGGNDAVPFTIPGAAELCDTMQDLPRQAKDKKLPDFLQALEKPNLAKPGTIAHVRLKLEGLETPERVTLGAWPNEKLRVRDRHAAGPGTLWDVPLLPLKALDLNDSAITIYWKEQALKPGGQREVGFEYGLWSLASKGSRLAATVDGAFRPDGELTVIAYVNRSASAPTDESVALIVPESFKLLEGDKTQNVPALPKEVRSDNYPITWKVRAGPTGTYQLTVRSSGGLAQALRVEIRRSIY